VEHESSLAERERHDKEKAEAIKARQIRLRHISDAEVDAKVEKTPSRSKAAPSKKSE
jgi:hypothetical protein